MAEIATTSRRVSQQAKPLFGLRDAVLALWRLLGRRNRPRRIRKETWSGYMLRDVGLDESAVRGSHDPRSLPLDWR